MFERRLCALAVSLLAAVGAIAVGVVDAAAPGSAATARVISGILGVEEKCVGITQSTVSPNWVLAYPAVVSDDCGDLREAVFELRSSGWARRYAPSGVVRLCPARPVPTPVAVDLGLCRTRSQHTYVAPVGGHGRVFRPARLALGAGVAFRASGWRGWDRASATATGELMYRGGHASAAALASNRVVCADGRWIYRRLVVRVTGRARGYTGARGLTVTTHC